MKKLIIIFMALIISVSVCTAAAAAQASDSQNVPSEKKTEERAKRSDRLEELQAAFDGLSVPQREQIYRINSKIADQYVKLVKKYCQYGVITKEEYEKFCKMVTETVEGAKEEGKMLFGVLPFPPSKPTGEQAHAGQ